VLTVIDTYSIGGAGKVVLQFLKNGGQELCEPRVAGFWRGPERSWEFREAVEALGVPVSVLRQRTGFDPRAIGAALKVARENGTQLLESHGYKAHLVCLAVKKLTGLPWVAYVHGWTSENAKIAVYNFIDKTAVRFADRIIPVSESVKERLSLSARAAEKTVVIANAADPVDPSRSFADLRKELGVAFDEILIAVVGRLSPEKGHRFLIEAMKRVHAEHSGVKAVFVGDGQERANLLAAIDSAGLAGAIQLAGYQTDVASYYNASDIVCLPSLSEGMPNAALEAMVFAKPVVASRVGGIPEVVLNGETGLLVPARDAEALARAIMNLADDRELRKRLGLAGKKRVEAEFDARARARKVAALYRSLVAGKA
jgi:glycosyltransferase involved in cell wall biosynthesis